MPVAVLTLDQRRSRGSADAVPDLLTALSRDLVTPPLRGFERTAGDEVQGVVDDAETLVELLARVLRDGGWNVGVGFGEVEQPLPDQTRAGRGEAFLAAREAVTRAKSDPHRLAVVARSEPGPGQEDAVALETVLGLWSGILERRTKGGWEVHDALNGDLSGDRGGDRSGDVSGDLTYSEVGERLGISQSAVSQRARAAAIPDERRARALVSVLCGRLLP